VAVELYILIALMGANASFWGIGGAIHYGYYVARREQYQQWKLQPDKFLSKRLDREAMWLGTLNLSLAAALFGFLAWGIIERGWSQLYYNLADRGLGYSLLQIFLAWLLIEGSAYYFHALCHRGWIYKKIHCVHHRYSAPTFFTISAMHPAEWFLHVAYIAAPAFLFPMHWGLYLFVVMATFVIGFWDHCGIKLPFDIPLHGSNRFHDDHHKYFHVNFGFTTPVFDRIHDTVRRQGHKYNEESFTGGKGVVKNIEQLGNNVIGGWVDY